VEQQKSLDRVEAFAAIRRGLELAHEYEYFAQRHPDHSEMLYSAAAVVRRTIRVMLGIESPWLI
jgi:hypothetical protein